MLPLVVDVDNADIMASLIALKVEVEEELVLQNPLRFTFSGGHEAPLIAKELGQAGVGIILTEPRPFPKQWEARRM